MAHRLPRLFLCAALAGCLVASTAEAQGDPEIKELALGFGLDLPLAVHVVAIEKGWFEEEGFEEVTTKTFTAGALAGEALVAGEIHLWTPGNLPPISMVHNAIPVVVLGIDSINLGLDKLVVRKDANVSAPEDLYDIKIGLLEGSTASLDLANLISWNGGLSEESEYGDRMETVFAFAAADVIYRNCDPFREDVSSSSHSEAMIWAGEVVHYWMIGDLNPQGMVLQTGESAPFQVLLSKPEAEQKDWLGRYLAAARTSRRSLNASSSPTPLSRAPAAAASPSCTGSCRTYGSVSTAVNPASHSNAPRWS
jgi:hypothetical protein